MSLNQVKDGAELPPKPLTLSIIREATRTSDEDELLRTRVLRLDWLGLSSLGDTLDLFDGLRELYLQYNRLTSIAGLELLQELELLTLGGNELREVEGLASLRALRALDIRNNHISHLGAGSLPVGLAICDLRGNPCASAPGYRARILALLPDCVCLDGEDLETADEESDADSEGQPAEGLTGSDCGAEGEASDAKEETALGATAGSNPFIVTDDSSTARHITTVAGAMLEGFQHRREAITQRFHERMTLERSRAEELAASALAGSEAQLAEATLRLAAAREAVSLHARERAESLAATAQGLSHAESELEASHGMSESKG